MDERQAIETMLQRMIEDELRDQRIAVSPEMQNHHKSKAEALVQALDKIRDGLHWIGVARM